MNFIKQRLTMIRAMETVARCINDEEVFEDWLTLGVADGDINEDTVDDELTYYTSDENFAEVMGVFLKCMKSVSKSGGLYCDGVISK